MFSQWRLHICRHNVTHLLHKTDCCTCLAILPGAVDVKKSSLFTSWSDIHIVEQIATAKRRKPYVILHVQVSLC